MLLKVISLLIFFCFTSSISNATTLNNRFNLILENDFNKTDNSINAPANIQNNSQLVIVNKKINLSQTLQAELKREISKTQKHLMQLNEFIAKENIPKIGLVYIHQGYENWSLQFTYGGYLLDTEEKIVVTTSEIFQLKEIFVNTKTLLIANKEYQTTRYMSQLGAILHQ